MSWPWPFLCPRFCKFTKSKQIWVEVLFDSDSQRCTGSWAAFLSASPPCWLSPVALPTSFKPGYLSCPRAASAGRAPAPPAPRVIPVESGVCGELIFSSTLFGIRTQPTVTLWARVWDLSLTNLSQVPTVVAIHVGSADTFSRLPTRERPYLTTN